MSRVAEDRGLVAGVCRRERETNTHTSTHKQTIPREKKEGKENETNSTWEPNKSFGAAFRNCLALGVSQDFAGEAMF